MALMSKIEEGPALPLCGSPVTPLSSNNVPLNVRIGRLSGSSRTAFVSMHLGAWLLVTLGSAVQATALQRDGKLQARENENVHITTGEPATDRTIFVVLSLLFTVILSFLLGSRIHRLKRTIRSRRNLTGLFLLGTYIVVICYIVVAAALVAGQGLYTYELCSAGTWVCLMFYITAKGFVYLFLCERVHIVRAPFVCRSKDKIYLACVIPAMMVFSAISINCLFQRITTMYDSDGRCHFGIGITASIPGSVINFVTNFFLTGVFIYLLRPIVKTSGGGSISAALSHDSKKNQPVIHDESAVQKNIRSLLWKSILGAVLTEIPVVANMIQFIITGGAELGMMCLTFCMIDVFWDCLVLHWLTFSTSSAAEKDLMRSTTHASSQFGLAADRREESVPPSRSCSQRELLGVQRPNASESAFVAAPDLEVAVQTKVP
ncbi:hypothetical protein C7974DRAFT_391701 [Boeremia exigua]|uniref:uncharacterized protein n=1 Tax=Boeremia exigua TaxID=749465 RepID=UPI001E8D7940|nr:uncharacterized protein C7974DRAFT_391701 [Boeremia exigua]KAH6638501.1 hypothetical protein C7974DRAFT_391701 [Boeremia exigua]